jgi:hypothetical protein
MPVNMKLSPRRRAAVVWDISHNLGAVSNAGLSAVGKENEPAMREYTLIVFDRHGR